MTQANLYQPVDVGGVFVQSVTFNVSLPPPEPMKVRGAPAFIPDEQRSVITIEVNVPASRINTNDIVEAIRNYLTLLE